VEAEKQISPLRSSQKRVVEKTILWGRDERHTPGAKAQLRGNVESAKAEALAYLEAKATATALAAQLFLVCRLF
jgi:hypothetical protein